MRHSITRIQNVKVFAENGFKFSSEKLNKFKSTIFTDFDFNIKIKLNGCLLSFETYADYSYLSEEAVDSVFKCLLEKNN